MDIFVMQIKIRSNNMMMMKNPSISLLSILFLLITVNSCQNNCKKGEGHVITRKIQAGAFKSIDVDGQAKVYIEQGNVPSIEITIDSNLYEYVKAEVSGEKLKIRENKCIEGLSEFKVKIVTSNFSKLIVDGSAKVRSDSLIKLDELVIQNNSAGDVQLNLDVNDLEVEAGGSGSVRLLGMALEVVLDVNDAGSVDAFGLQAKNVDVNVKDAASAKIYASEKFTGKLGGSGNILYKGNPKKVDTKITGTGTIQSR
jgi:hypothetical protein